MPQLGLPILSTLALGGGLVLFRRSFRDLRLRQLIQNTPTARIRSMAMGLVEINGAVEAHSSVAAPFSGRPCVYWEVDIAIQGRQRSWSTVHRNASGQPFYVRDETGLALVFPRGARCTVRHGTEEQCMGIALPDCYAQYMKDQGIGRRHLWRLTMMRFRERVLEEGQRVYVLGSAVPRPRVSTISEGEAIEATGTDGMRARRIQALHQETDAVIRQGENEPAFIISQNSEREVAMDLGLHATGKLIAGPAIALLGLAGWLEVISHGWK